MLFHPLHIKGIVKDQKEEPIADAWINILGVHIRTKIDGTFDTHLILSPEDMSTDISLQVSQLGYQTHTEHVDTDLQEVTFDITLEK